MFRLKSGPAQLTRRLVAIGDEVYATLGLEAPVSALDAATGETLRTYAGTEKTEEIIYSDGVLFLLINEQPFRQPRTPTELVYDFVEAPRRVMAVDAASGRGPLEQAAASVLPITLTADDRHVLFCGDERIVCLDRSSGEELWQSEPVQRRQVDSHVLRSDAGRLPGCGPVLRRQHGTRSEERDGRRQHDVRAWMRTRAKMLWTADHPASGYKSAEDILVVDGLAWITENTFGNQSGVVRGLDPRTGQGGQGVLARRRDPLVPPPLLPGQGDGQLPAVFADGHRVRRSASGALGMPSLGPRRVPVRHHAGQRDGLQSAASVRLLPGGQDVRLQRPGTGSGVDAAASRDRVRPIAWNGARLTTRSVVNEAGSDRASDMADVPQGHRTQRIRPQPRCRLTLKQAWSTPVGGRLSALTIAGGQSVRRVGRHAHRSALDADTGRTAWNYTTGGRVDSPPTIWHGRVLFGSADGYVYCLRADDGDWSGGSAPPRPICGMRRSSRSNRSGPCTAAC